ncbi:MAG: DUF1553 domain-containing protein [Verrucomicrobia bacterium]|nr:DUF1553 domain-containing protein [Verrucomicrobiota bacterium]
MRTAACIVLGLALAILLSQAESQPPAARSTPPWWSFQPLRAPQLPSGSSSSPHGNEIDRFIDAELSRRGLESNPPASRRTLLRRASYDLTGLPPNPDLVEAFLADPSPDAWPRLIDRLLASVAYGERWARHWLDVVRYADFHDANPKARVASCEPLEAWRFRDWVVTALNRDLPYGQFIVHHIAGDLLPAPPGQEFNAEGLAATTFLSNGVWDRGDADKEKIVSDMVDDQIDTIGKAFLGLTLGCARCHDHKFDPVTQRDYYALAGVFYSTRVLEELGTKGGEYTLLRTPLASDREASRWKAQQALLARLESDIKNLDQKKPPVPADSPQRRRLTHQRDLLKRSIPVLPMSIAAREGGTPGGLFPHLQDVPIHLRGQYSQLGERVPRRFPAWFVPPHPTPASPPGSAPPSAEFAGSGRLALAQWIVSEARPLMARVLVNRIWQHHFGEGLVRTAGNFGKLGETPTHPELLDWLASYFLHEGGSIKALHRKMLLSEAYQRSSSTTPALRQADPENRWLARFTSRRLEAEAIRDTILSVSGSLSFSGGGPADDDLQSSRRSLYVQTARWDRGSFAMLFDAANPDASVDKRFVSTVAPQALFLLNHPFMLEHAARFARIVRAHAGTDADRVTSAYQGLLSRVPTPSELKIALQFLNTNKESNASMEARWDDFAQLLLWGNEWLFLD